MNSQAVLGGPSSLRFAFNTNCTVFSIHVCLAAGCNMETVAKDYIQRTFRN